MPFERPPHSKEEEKNPHYLIPSEISLNLFYYEFDEQERERERARKIEQIERANFLVVDATACVAVVSLCSVYISTEYRFMRRFNESQAFG